MRHYALAAALGCVVLSGRAADLSAGQTAPLNIVRMTPRGDDVPAARQVVIEFNRPVVPVGRMDRTADEVGVTIEPPLNCQWRWLNTSALACNLGDKEAMRPATHYKVTVNPAIKAEDSGQIAAPYIQEFMTQRPDSVGARFADWRSPGHPVIRVIFNQPVTKSSVAAHMYFSVSTMKDAGPVRQAVTVSADKEDDAPPFVLPVPGEKAVAVFRRMRARHPDDKATVTEGGEEARRIWMIEPAAELPANAHFALVQERGLVSALGPVTGIDHAGPVVEADIFPDFRFAGIRCWDENNQEVTIMPGSAQGKPCNPLQSVSLGFSVPVLRSQVKDNASFKPDLANGRKDYNPWGDENRDDSLLDQPYRKDRIYYIGLPVGLKAAHRYTVHISGRDEHFGWMVQRWLHRLQPLGIEDQFGRGLAQSVTVDFTTGHRNPNFEMDARQVVLEKNADADVPVYVDNLNSFALDYRAVTPAGDTQGRPETVLPHVEDIQFAVPMGVRGLIKESGALYGSVSTVPVIYKSKAEEPRLFAEVTPWQVHLKMGHFQSVAWVVDMASGLPVEGAKVEIYKDSFPALSSGHDAMASAVTGKDGVAVLPGAETLDPQQDLLRAWREEDTRLFLRVDKGRDMALLPLSSDFAINTWRAADEESLSAGNRDRHGHMIAWGMTAQGVYRAGDTIQYKLFVRDQDNRTLAPAPDARYSLRIIDPMGKKAGQVDDVRLSAFGTYAGEFQVPKTGAVGWYQFRLTANFSGKDMKDDTAETAGDNQDNENDEGETDRSGDNKVVRLSPLRVLVSDFTPSPFAVGTELSGDRFHAGDTMKIGVGAHLHSGGAYGNAAVRATVMVESKPFAPSNPAAKGFTFDSFAGESESEQIYQKKAMLDDKGEWKDSLVLPQQKIAYGALEVEGAVQDDRGKSVAAMAHADYAGVDRLVGLKSSQFVYQEKKPVSIPAIVVDDKGNPVPGVPVNVTVEEQVIDTVKVKGAGNAYLSDTTTNWKQIASCSLTSGAEGANCNFTPASAGTYRVTASIKDTHGTAHSTNLELWVSGDDYVQWDDHSENVLPIVPEKKEYRVGDTARFIIKNPYPGARALVTVERYGVIESFVRTLEGSAPVIEIPVKPDDLPGFYMSVVVTSPRVAKPLPGEGQVDLGKPAFRMGYVAINVRDPYKEMKVSVRTDQPVYRPRDVVKADFQAEPRFAPEQKQPVELAVAVVDEAVFDLIAGGRAAYDPYKGFYNLEPLDVRNYDLLTQLIGRRKFEKKGANPGGDGGKDVNMRNIFKFVGYWNPSVPVDGNGKAHIEFPAPDNLTGWRVLALATTPTDRMGLGEGTFKVNRPTELRPAMPNQVREGDSFAAGFSVMNRTDKARTVTVKIEARGDLDGGKPQSVRQAVVLKPYQRQTVNVNLKAAMLPVDRDLSQGTVSFTATAGDDTDKDGMEFSLPVNKTRTLDVGANYATTVDDKAQEHIAFPKDIYTDTGDVSVVLSPSVIANLTGAFRYMRDYPYLCWEQILSKGVMAGHYIQLKKYMPADFIWTDADKLPQGTLDQAASFQAPNGGMTYFEPQDKYADPYLSAYTAMAFRWLRKDGYKVPDEVEGRLQDYLKKFLSQDTAPDFYEPGMSATVRAVALAALADAGKADKDDLLRFEPYLKDMSLFGKAHFLRAAATLGTVPDAAKNAADMIFATGSETGGKFMFNETHDDGFARILTTPVRDNCAVLDAFLLYGKDGPGKDMIGDKPFKLVRAVTQSRGSRDYWENTQENMFCMNALADYARAYESETPAMKVRVAMDGQALGAASFKAFTDAPVTVTRPVEKDDPGRAAVLDITREGAGRLYYATRLRYAPTAGHKDAVDAGFDIHREYNVRKNGQWTLLKPGEAIHQGDVVRVDLFLSLPAARNFVAVNDPVPGGLEPVNRDLATASKVDADAGEFDRTGGSMWFKFNDWREYNFSRWSFYHQELRHDSARFFADRLEPGNYHLSYTAQAVAQGSFAIPPARAEEMYDPDVYGTGTDGMLTVQAALNP